MLFLRKTVYVLTVAWSVRLYVFVEKWVLIWKLYICCKWGERTTLICSVRLNKKNRLKILQLFLLWTALHEENHLILKSQHKSWIADCAGFVLVLLIALSCLVLSNGLVLVKKPTLADQISWKSKTSDCPGILSEIHWGMNTCWLILLSRLRLGSFLLKDYLFVISRHSEIHLKSWENSICIFSSLHL